MKNPFKNLSSRTIRSLYTFWTIVVLTICLINFSLQMLERSRGNDQCRWVTQGESRELITGIVGGGVAEQAGLRDGDILIKIDGQSFKNGNAAQAIIDKKVDTHVLYTIERDGVQMEKRILIKKMLNIAYLAQFLFGLGFLLVGYVVVMMKPQGKVQKLFARACIFSMLFFGLFVMNLDPAVTPVWKIFLLGSGFVIASVFAPPVFLRFFLFFPVQRKGHKSKILTAILYILSISILAGLLLLANNPKVIMYALILLFSRYIFFLFGFGIFIHSFYALVPPDRQPQLRPILYGVAIGTVLFAYGVIVQMIDPTAPFLNPFILLPIMFLFVVPMFFGYAIFRYRLMDVDVLIRRSLIYGGITASLAAIYLLSIYGIGTLVNYFFGAEENQLLIIISLIVVAFVFDPVKQKLQSSIDRVFFRERYDYQKALLEFTQEIPRLMEMEHILHSIVQRLSSTMHIEKISVFICGEKEGCKSVAQNMEEADCTFAEGSRTLIALLQKTHRPIDLHLLDDEYDRLDLLDEEKQKILRSGVVLSVPMFLKDRLIGFINVGPKMSGKIYSQEDVNLLATVAGQAAIAIENSRLHKSEIVQERMKEELDLARKIQQGLFPKKNPEIPGLDFAGISVPASSVGGDYYDFIQLAPHKILAVVADVSGKGMSAALYMSKIQGMVQLAGHMYNTPKEMLTHINRRIFEGLDRKSFITMILALFDLKKKEVRICRAGHNKALYGKNGTIRFLESDGIGLGLERGPIFEDAIEEVRIPIAANSLFLFYTDGITEAMNEHKHQFGEHAVIDLLKTKRQCSAEEIQNAILDRVKKFRGSADQHDDVTMIVVKGAAIKKLKKSRNAKR